MKNLMIYINPRKDFDDEGKVTVKIQIDNSLDLGWKREEIMLVTNFPYEYNKIKAIEISDKNFCDFHPPISKINTIIDMFDKKFVNKNELYWFHDLDVFQNEVIRESELELDNADMGVTDKGRIPAWNTGTIFFKDNSKDIFDWMKEVAYKYNTDEEHALTVLTMNNLLWATTPSELIGDRVVPADIPGTENINERVKKINISYNFRMWNIRSTIRMAVKPIRVVHFHPLERNELDFFMHGKNKINTVLMPDRLIKIFHKYDIN